MCGSTTIMLASLKTQELSQCCNSYAQRWQFGVLTAFQSKPLYTPQQLQLWHCRCFNYQAGGHRDNMSNMFILNVLRAVFSLKRLLMENGHNLAPAAASGSLGALVVAIGQHLIKPSVPLGF